MTVNTMGADRTYIVTGGAGFVGANLVAELQSREPRAHLIVVDSFRSGSTANIRQACERRGCGPFTGSIVAHSTSTLDWEGLTEVHEPAAIFHLGAITDTTVTDEAEMIRENFAGFERLLRQVSRAASENRTMRLVYASSAATYGTPPHTARREAFPLSAAGRPDNVYGFSKWLMECAHRRAQAAEPALPIVGLRYFNVFGPGEERKGHMASMVLQLARRLLSGEAPRLFADGSQRRDQVYVDDVVACTLAAGGVRKPADRPPRPGVYNLGSGVATSFNEIIETLREALEIPESAIPTEYFDMPAHIRRFYQDFTLAEMSETASGLGWTPAWQPADGIRTYARWLRESGRAT